MFSLNYTLDGSGFVLSDQKNERVGTITPMILGGRLVMPREWSVMLDASILPVQQKFKSLDAAKYRALSDYIEHLENTDYQPGS